MCREEACRLMNITAADPATSSCHSLICCYQLSEVKQHLRSPNRRLVARGLPERQTLEGPSFQIWLWWNMCMWYFWQFDCSLLNAYSVRGKGILVLTSVLCFSAHTLDLDLTRTAKCNLVWVCVLPGKHACTLPIVNQTGSNRKQRRSSQSKSKFITPDKCTADSLDGFRPDFCVIVLARKVDRRSCERRLCISRPKWMATS